MPDVTMRRMLEAGVHFGHQTRFWNPQMAPYIFGERNKIHIVNLEKTLPLFEQAVSFVRKIVADNGVVLFVGSKRAARHSVTEHARRAGMPFVSQRWLGGMLTNFKTIRQSIKRLKELEELTEAETHRDFTKKEVLKMARERDKLERGLGGIKDMDSLPDAIFIIDVGHEEIALREANKLGIPVVAVVDTNCAPTGVDYVIPGNDDAMRAIELYAEGMADAVLDGKASIPEMPVGEGDFVELDEEGRPVVGQDKQTRGAGTKKKARPSKARTKKTAAAGGTAEADAAAAADGAAAADIAAAGADALSPGDEAEPAAAGEAPSGEAPGAADEAPSDEAPADTDTPAAAPASAGTAAADEGSAAEEDVSGDTADTDTAKS